MLQDAGSGCPIDRVRQFLGFETKDNFFNYFR